MKMTFNEQEIIGQGSYSTHGYLPNGEIMKISFNDKQTIAKVWVDSVTKTMKIEPVSDDSIPKSNDLYIIEVL